VSNSDGSMPKCVAQARDGSRAVADNSDGLCQSALLKYVGGSVGSRTIVSNSDGSMPKCVAQVRDGSRTVTASSDGTLPQCVAQVRRGVGGVSYHSE
jgi:hypothetical protein